MPATLSSYRTPEEAYEAGFSKRAIDRRTLGALVNALEGARKGERAFKGKDLRRYSSQLSPGQFAGPSPRLSMDEIGRITEMHRKSYAKSPSMAGTLQEALQRGLRTKSESHPLFLGMGEEASVFSGLAGSSPEKMVAVRNLLFPRGAMEGGKWNTRHEFLRRLARAKTGYKHMGETGADFYPKLYGRNIFGSGVEKLQKLPEGQRRWLYPELMERIQQAGGTLHPDSWLPMTGPNKFKIGVPAFTYKGHKITDLGHQNIMQRTLPGGRAEAVISDPWVERLGIDPVINKALYRASMTSKLPRQRANLAKAFTPEEIDAIQSSRRLEHLRK